MDTTVVDPKKDEQGELEHRLNIATQAGRGKTGAVSGAHSICRATTSIEPTLSRIGDYDIYLHLHLISGYSHARAWGLDGNQEDENHPG